VHKCQVLVKLVVHNGLHVSLFVKEDTTCRIHRIQGIPCSKDQHAAKQMDGSCHHSPNTQNEKKTHTNAMPYGSILVFPLRPSRSRPYEPTMVDPATDQRHERCCQKWTDLTGRSSRPLPAQITVAEGLAATYRVEEIGSRWPEGKWCSRSRFCARSVGKGSLRVGWRGVGRQPAVGSTD
jgi:hypothetical protein